MESETRGDCSLAFERRGGRLKVMLEEAVPRIRLQGVTYYVTESPSVMVDGKKHFVEEIV